MFVHQPAPLRSEPDDDSEQVSELLPGEPLRVVERRGAWALVETAYDYRGWVSEAALGGDPDPAWLEPTPGAPLDHARTLLGVPYRWGGMTAHGIDCSGLVHMSFRAVGRLVPRDAADQEAAARVVDEARPGDLVFYGVEDRADHVAFWLGDGRILHASGREGVRRVLEEAEPHDLTARRRAVRRL